MTATTAQISFTLAELRRAVADRFGDYLQLTATGNGLATTIVDAINVNAGSEHYNGRQLICITGHANNVGKVRRVTATSDTNSTLTVTPAFSNTTATNDTFDVFNRRGIGFQIQEYNRAINAAINDAFPLGMVELVSELTTGNLSINDYITTITVPDNIYEVYAVEFKTDENTWHPVVKATRSNSYGWRARPDGKIEIQGVPQDNTEESTLRLRGYGRQDALSADSSTSLLNKEWTVSRAAYYLALGALARGSEYGAMAQQFQREAEMTRTRLRTVRNPGSERVRSV